MTAALARLSPKLERQAALAHQDLARQRAAALAGMDEILGPEPALPAPPPPVLPREGEGAAAFAHARRRVEPLRFYDLLADLWLDTDLSLMVRRGVVLTVLGLLAFLWLPERTAAEQAAVLIRITAWMTGVFLTSLLSLMLWGLWRRD